MDVLHVTYIYFGMVINNDRMIESLLFSWLIENKISPLHKVYLRIRMGVLI